MSHYPAVHQGDGPEIDRWRRENASLRAQVESLTAERDRQRGAAEKYYAEVETLKKELEGVERLLLDVLRNRP